MPDWIPNPSPQPKPKPMGSLIASAKRITSEQIKGRAGGHTQTLQIGREWQSDAWDMYDLVGEQHFLASTLASRLSQARLFVGRMDPESQTDNPDPLESSHPAVLPLEVMFNNSPGGSQQLLTRLGSNLYVAGEGWVVSYTDEMGQHFRACSVDEVSTTREGTVKVEIDNGESVEIDPDEEFVIRVWRSHPRRWWEADASTRASLPVLRELVGLTLHISAQVDSRLAGAGVFIVPQSAKDSLNNSEDGDDDTSFVDALIHAMLTPISDRGSAAALVPLVITAPDEVTDKFRHITFAQELDDEARELRDEAIRRLALSQDAPPEVLLGTGNMNHWGAYLVQEDVVTTHLEPPLSLICDALTSQYLRPALAELGVDNPEQYVVWYDINHLVVRPNRTSEAVSLHERGAITDQALRAAAGFEDSDAPVEEDSQPTHVQLALDMVRRAPSLAVEPGIPALVEQLRSVFAGEEAPTNVIIEGESEIPSNVPSEIGDAGGPVA